jgi:hypothetical protein
MYYFAGSSLIFENGIASISQLNTAPIPESAYPKLSKAKSGYLEINFFKNADLSAGYFCYNCAYFIKPNYCAIVEDAGPDVDGQQFGIIEPRDVCALWEENTVEAQ